jgi:MarR family transcriptional regulator, organic hydroperoxide resistance regulator
MATLRTDAPAVIEPLEALDYGLRRLMWLEHKRMAEIMAEHNLTVPQFFVLVNLVHGEHGCTIGDLASKLSQSNPTITGIIDRLEGERLVVRTRGGETDRRKVMVQVTPRGRSLLERAKNTRRENIRRALVGFSAYDLETFMRLLNTYLVELEKEA